VERGGESFFTLHAALINIVQNAKCAGFNFVCCCPRRKSKLASRLLAASACLAGWLHCMRARTIKVLIWGQKYLLLLLFSLMDLFCYYTMTALAAAADSELEQLGKL
jgi:hypothetical protein